MHTQTAPSGSFSIALLEDDLHLRDQVLVPKLQRYGFDVSPFEKASDLYASLATASYQMVVLDVGLPDTDGFTVAHELRRTRPDLGILMLTGRSTSPDHVRGLSVGADAYLTKPVEIDVLAATLHSVARRLPGHHAASSASHPEGWRLGGRGWCLMTPRGRVIALTKTERLLMARMLESDGVVVSREELIGAVTDNVFDFDPHRIDSMVHRIRRKVNDRSDESLPLVSVRGEGYLFTNS